VLNGVLLVLDELVLPEATKLVSLDVNSVVGRVPDDPLDSDVGEIVPRGIVQSQHGPGGGRGTLLDVTGDVKLE
jgi:hypothetical protein